MPYTAEHKRQTRQRIVREAAHAFRERGLDGVSVPGVMSQAGLTHGGFYAHFASKDALIASSFSEGFGESAERLLTPDEGTSTAEALDHFVRAYLSRAHRDEPATGCVVPSLTSEVARASGEVRAGFTAALREYAHRLAQLLPGADDAERDTAALTLLAEMAGALQLSRAVDDPALSDAILLRARRQAWAVIASMQNTSDTSTERIPAKEHPHE
ncbi:MAG TPA: TetR/AcrR family transcriptional regulator [Ktedonobacterales bacterium]